MYAMKSLILLIAASLLSLNGFSQITERDLKELNIRLAQGLECCQMQEILQEEVNLLDSINMFKDLQLRNLQEQLSITQNNAELDSMRFERSMQDVTRYKAENEKLKRRVRTFRTLTAVTGTIIVGAALLISL